ncbi:MAG: glycosyltransferase family 2 protein [Bacteroidales bacterium]|nr:glycosyltransferase family 2 protein [Candidatus Sodaliphilus fimicaballi]
MKKITILVPCYNEEKSLPLLHDRLSALMDGMPQYAWEVILVNDGSRDNTLEAMRLLHDKDSRMCYIDLSRNFGKERAMLAGFDHATGDCMVIMDADLQHPPEVIPEMIKHWEDGWEDVYARRNTRGKESWLRRKLTLMYYRMLQSTTSTDVLENVGDFRLLDRKCIDALKELRECERYTKGLYSWIGFKKKEITFDQQDRIAGNSSFNLFKLASLAMQGVTSFTTAPLKLATVLGFVVSVVAFIYMCYILVKTILYGDPVQGYPTLIIVILFLGGVQLLSLGIIGEYLGRIFNETKNRPVYFVREKEGV